MRRLGLILALLLAPTIAFAQGAVLQQGGVFKGHNTMFLSNGYVADAGGPLANGLAPVDPVSGLLPLGMAWVNSGLGVCGFSGYAASAYSSLCLGFDGNGNGLITLGNSGGSSPSLTFNINGTPYPFPGIGSGNVIAPTAPAPNAGDAVYWNGSTAVKDGGPPTASFGTNSLLQADTFFPVGTTVLRQSFWPGIMGGYAAYTLSATNCSAPDNGLQITPHSGSGCWLADLVGKNESPMLWGATGSAVTVPCGIASTTATCNSGTGDFQKGMPVAIYGAGPTSTAPSATIGVTPINGSGTTSYYAAVPIDASMGPGAASPVVSVSGGGGGGVLGAPFDFDYFVTVNTHGNTTVDNIQLNGVPCTYTTCPMAVGAIVQSLSQFSVGTTISTINSPTSITISAPALATATGVSIFFNSPNGGVYNQIAVSGAASSYAIYEGSTSSLSSMTCVGVLDGNGTLNGGNFNDFGPTHYTPCPAWLPAVPSASPSGQVLRTTIANISGNTITLANGASAPLAATTMLHDDTAALTAALAANVPLQFPCNTFNIFGPLQMQATTYDGARCALINGYGSSFDDLTFGAGSATGKMVNMTGDDSGKSCCFGLVINGPAQHVDIDSYTLNNRYNGIEIAHANSPVLTNIVLGPNGRGDQAVYLWSPAATQDINPYLNKIISSRSVTSGGLLVDSNVSALTAINTDMQISPREYVYQNTIASGNPPFSGRFTNGGCNFGWGGPCFNIQAATGQLSLDHMYLQGVGGGNGAAGGSGAPCVLIAPGVYNVAIVNQTAIFGCDHEGVYFAGHYLQMGDGTDEVWANSSSQNGIYSKVKVDNGAGPATIKLQAGDNFASTNANSSVTREKCGIEIISGAGIAGGQPMGAPSYDVTTAAPGIQAAVCDETATYGLVKIDGEFNSPTWVTNPAGGTLTTAQMLGNQNTTLPAINVSGNVSGTPATWTTPTAAALVAAVPNASVNQRFNFQILNLGGSNAVLGQGVGVTVTTATTAPFGAHVYHCFFSNVSGGTEAATCAG